MLGEECCTLPPLDDDEKLVQETTTNHGPIHDECLRSPSAHEMLGEASSQHGGGSVSSLGCPALGGRGRRESSDRGSGDRRLPNAVSAAGGASGHCCLSAALSAAVCRVHVASLSALLTKCLQICLPPPSLPPSPRAHAYMRCLAAGTLWRYVTISALC